MPDWLVWTVAISTVVAAIAQIVATALQWFLLREVGDMDGNRTDWWEKWPWRRKDAGN